MLLWGAEDPSEVQGLPDGPAYSTPPHPQVLLWGAEGPSEVKDLPNNGGLFYPPQVLLWGAEGPSEVKARLRAEIMRWHPDKFVAR